MEASTVLLRIYLLGDIRLEWDGRVVALPRRESVLRLFARLALEPGRVWQRGPLAFGLWPDMPEADALANLRRHLYLLRTALPEPARTWLTVSARAVTWNPGPAAWCDFFELVSGAADEASQARAAALYRGELAAGVNDDEVILALRERARLHYAGLLKRLATQALGAQAFQQGLTWARALVALDPWDEAAVRLKMNLEALSGNRAAAVATYEALAASLKAELQTLPLPETMALYADLIHNRVRPPARKLEAPGAPLFIGRRSELRRLADAIADLARGHGQTIFVSGEAGAGKTALVRAALQHDPSGGERGLRVFWAGCHPVRDIEEAQPYGFWQQILGTAAPILAHRADIAPALLNQLLPLVPDLAVLRPGLLAPSQPSASDLRGTIKQALLALAQPEPFVVAIEDAHWADRLSLELADDIASSTNALLLVITHRAGDASKALQDLKRVLRRRRRAQDLTLAPFTSEESRRFLEEALGGHALTPGLIDELTAYANGLPLLLREAVDSLLDAWPEAVPVRPPTGLRDAIRIRLDRLAPDAREALDGAAILGFSFLDSELRAVLNWRPGRYDAALDVLLARRLLVPSGPDARDDYAFNHQLVHEVLLAAIAPEAGHRRHAAIGRVLETLYGDVRGQAARIARHYESGGLFDQAAPFWLSQAEEVADLAAFEQARALIGHVVQGLADEAELHGQVLARAALLQAALAHYEGRSDEALRLLEAALPRCREYPALTCQALTLEAFVLSVRDRWREGYARAAEAVQLARAAGDISAEASALNLAGICRMMFGETRAAVGDLALALDQLEAAGRAQTSLYTQTLNHFGTALVFVQDYQRAVAVLERTVAQTRAAGLRRLEAAALTMLGQVALNRGRYAEAIALYTQSIEVVGDSYRPGLWAKFAGRGAAYLRRGDVAAARADFELGLALTTQLGTRYGQTLMQGYLTSLRLTRRGMAFADGPSLKVIEQAAAEAGVQPVVMMAANLTGQIWRLMGDLRRSREAHERALCAAEQTQTPAFLVSARAHLWQTRALEPNAAEARCDLEDLLALARAAGETPVLVRGLLALSALERTGGGIGRALAAAGEASTLAQACPDQALVAEAEWARALAQTAAGDAAGARRSADQARRLAQTEYWPLLAAMRHHPILFDATVADDAPQAITNDLLSLIGSDVC